MEEKSVAICLKVANEASYYSVELSVLWHRLYPWLPQRGQDRTEYIVVSVSVPANCKNNIQRGTFLVHKSSSMIAVD